MGELEKKRKKKSKTHLRLMELKDLKEKAKEEIKGMEVVTSVNRIVGILLKLMKNHIGADNPITRRRLFVKIYNIEPELVSELQEFMMWELIKKAMHKCRQRTKCFIISQLRKVSAYSSADSFGGVWHFWVADDISDFHLYRDKINKSVKAMRSMVNKCQKSIDKEWYKAEWEWKYG